MIRYTYAFAATACISLSALCWHSPANAESKEINLAAPVNANYRANGLVASAETATNVAIAILVPIFGQSEIENQRPFLVSQTSEAWVISGHLPPNKVGGTFKIEISKKDARVISLTHGR